MSDIEVLAFKALLMKYHGFVYLFIVLLTLVTLIVTFVVGIYVGFELSEKDYKNVIIPTLSVIGTWAGVLATFSAVVISLWLAYRQISQDREDLNVWVNMQVIAGVKMSPCIGVRVVSKGNKPANIVSMSWLGENASEAILVARYNQHSEQLPITLSYGETTNLILSPGFESHLKEYVQNYLNGRAEGLYLSINTTLESHKIKLGADVIQAIEKH